MVLKIVVLLKILQMVHSIIPINFSIECAEKGGFDLRDECLIFSTADDKLSWNDAVGKCQQYGHLVIPEDPEGLYQYALHVYDHIPAFWIGAYSPPYENSFRWINGKSIPEDFPWGHGEPTPPISQSEERCVEIDDGLGGYASQPCTEERSYICSLDACGTMGGVTLGHQCLLFKEHQNATWEEATHACTLEGGQLAIPAYPKLLDNYVHEHFTEGEHFWLGGLKIDVKDEDSWYWLNGQPIEACEIPWGPNTKENQDVITQCLNVKALSGIEQGEGFNHKICDHPSGFICELNTTMKPPSTCGHFLISQISSGEYIGPDTVFPHIKNGDILTLHSTIDPNMHMAFDIVDGKWGYIRHVITGKILTPKADGTLAAPMNPPDGTNVVLQSDLRPWALFALDQYQNRIIHRSGKFISSDGKCITITGDESKNNTMGFQFMSIDLPYNKEVLPYCYPNISCDWQLVLSAENLDSTTTYEAKVSIGRSKSLSSSHDFKFGFEVENDKRSSISTTSCSGWIWNRMCTGSSSSLGAATTDSLLDEMEQASSDTWDSEKSQDISFKVEAGKSVAVWQRMFILEHKGHKSVHLANMYRETTSPCTKPNNCGCPERPGFLFNNLQNYPNRYEV